MSRQVDIFSPLADRMPLGEQMELALQSLQAYGPEHEHWCIAWSGGKDSTTLLTLILFFISSGQLAAPKSLTVFYADTRMELPPLAAAALAIIEKLRAIGITVEVVMAEMDKRFLVYMLGRGVPPPNNNTFRWCTRQIKVDPMAAAIERRLEEIPGKVLMLTGVRQGESAIRDRRIIMSCTKDGGECGQGWYQQVLPEAKGIRGRIATLAPILHFRVCNVWDWLRIYAPMAEYGGWPTAMLADAYGGDEAEESEARTGCNGCPLATLDLALDAVLKMLEWAHLAPLKRLRPIYRELRKPHRRLKKTGLEIVLLGDVDRDGVPIAEQIVSTGKNKQRMGPLTFEARLWALGEILTIQAEINVAAARLGRPGLDMLNAEEEARIRELIAAQTWPNGWDGDEPTADTPLDAVYRDGSIQPLLFGAFE